MPTIIVGDLVKVNNRARDSYQYTKPNSKGVVLTIGKDSETDRDAALVRFVNSPKMQEYSSGEEFAILVNHLSKLPETKIIKGVKKKICKECLEYHKEEDMKDIDNKKICKECYSKYKKCTVCHKREIPSSKNKTINRKFYCEKCMNKLFITCDKCGEKFPKENTKKFRIKVYCEKCFKDTFAKCAICGKLGSRNTLQSYRRIGMICKECWNKPITIKNYSYMPKPLRFSKLNNENGETLYMGLELEVMTRESSRMQAKLMVNFYNYLSKLNIDNLFYFKEDSSLMNRDGSNGGVEIVTHPFTNRFSHKNMKFKKVLGWLKENKFVSYRGGKCGLHVHLSRNFFTPEDIHKMRLFFSTNIDNLIAFSKRDEKGLNGYAKPEKYNMEKYKEFYKNLGDETFNRPGRHAAINISGKGTVELRIFRGTLYYPRFLATLQFCEAISNFVKKFSAIVMKDKRSWELFKEFLAKENKWSHLQKYLLKERL